MPGGRADEPASPPLDDGDVSGPGVAAADTEDAGVGRSLPKVGSTPLPAATATPPMAQPANAAAIPNRTGRAKPTPRDGRERPTRTDPREVPAAADSALALRNAAIAAASPGSSPSS
ncbi:hypothetical protein H3L99_22030 [Streptomyces pristinaespiralis]|uniref:hypothetical protein n=1 Tax=Streptomyces pristinaespiralis TaxID=38300 RepID=UPI0015F7EF15|nr:hypothetical protein [Streptomyces pristinaespiralis]QMU15959.1 hypothetical protein H3L99_22030 [Streptomyces pristinaespiralis]